MPCHLFVTIFSLEIIRAFVFFRSGTLFCHVHPYNYRGVVIQCVKFKDRKSETVNIAFILENNDYYVSLLLINLHFHRTGTLPGCCELLKRRSCIIVHNLAKLEHPELGASTHQHGRRATGEEINQWARVLSQMMMLHVTASKQIIILTLSSLLG